MSTFAAAPWAAASASSDATSRSLDAFTLLRPASASATPTSSRQASTQSSGTSAALARRRPQRGRRGRPARPRSRGAASSRPPRSRRTPRRRRRRASGSGRRGRGPVASAQARRSACCRVLRPAWDSDATIATRPAPEAGRDGGRTAAAGNGFGRGEPRDERIEVRSRKRSDRGGRHAAIVGTQAASRRRDVHPCTTATDGTCRQASETGRARYRRTRPATDGGPTREGRDCAVASGAIERQAARRIASSRPVDGPSPRSVVVGQGQAGAGRLDLEQRARTGDHRIGRGLLADRARDG